MIDPALWITSDEAMHDANHNFWGDKKHRHVPVARLVEESERAERESEEEADA